MADDELLVQEGEGAPAPAPETEPDPADDVSAAVAKAFRQATEKAAPAPEARAPGEEGDRGDGRDAQGRFASKPAQAQPQAAEASPESSQPQQATFAPQAQQTAFAPPPGWSAQAKAAFGSLPPEVQQAVAHREEEINRGFAVLQDYKGLDEFKDVIAQNRTTYRDVIDRALQWERATITDPVGTILHLAQMRGISPQLLVGAITDPRVRAQMQQARPAPQPQQPALTPDAIRQMAREEYERASQARAVDDHVSGFLSDPQYPHARAISDDIALLIEGGRAKDLADAYQLALRLHPELATASQSTATQRQQQVANQARQAAKATVGAPSGGKTPTGSAASPKTVEEAVKMAFDRQMGR